MIKTILFDLGNVLIDYRPEIFIQRLHQRTKIDTNELVKYFLWSELDKSYTEGKISSDEFFGSIIRDLKIDCSKEEFQDYWNNIFFCERGDDFVGAGSQEVVSGLDLVKYKPLAF